MKITSAQLRRIIREESARILENEGMGADPQAVQSILMNIKSSIDELANLYMSSVDADQPVEMDAVYAFSQAFDDLKAELGL